ncbi:MAG: alginate export family protein [Burkholderiales bacterium]
MATELQGDGADGSTRAPARLRRVTARIAATLLAFGGTWMALLLSQSASAQSGPEADTCPSRADYRNLRYEENWRYMADPACMENFSDRLKYIPLDESGSRYVSLGGEARLRYENVRHPAFGADSEDHNGYFLKRYLLHADAHASQWMRVFVQLQSANESGRRDGPRAEDEDDLDFNQLFVDLQVYRDGQDHFTLRAGRHEFEFGMSRLLSARDGMNTRQSFDGFRGFGRLGRWNFNTSLARPVNTRPGAFDNYASSHNGYAGASAWTDNPLLPGSKITFLSNYRKKHDAEFDLGTGEDRRHTTGVRFWSEAGGAWDFNWEGGVQYGSFEGRKVRAWYFASDTGYTFTDADSRPRLGLRLDATSGDRNAQDGRLNTFRAPFASTAYSGLAGQLGPSNVIDLAPSLSWSLREDVRVTAGVIGFWRTSQEDGVYTTTGGLRRTGQTSDARHVGNQGTLQVVYMPARYWTVLALLSYFDAGRFLDETPPAQNVTYFTAWITYRF